MKKRDKKVKLFANATEKINTKKYTQKIRRKTSRKKKVLRKKRCQKWRNILGLKFLPFFLFRLFDVLATKILLH